MTTKRAIWTTDDVRTYAPCVRLTDGRTSMVKTIGVGTDGSDTAQKAVDFALDMAERYQAKLVIASAYRPVSEDRVRKEREEAPQEIKWSINPTEEVDATLRAVEE